jgi:archaellum component FlaG (FlaF/FlaG flagellin family)
MKPGDVMRVAHAPDQPPWVRTHAGKCCILIKNLQKEDGVFSTSNAWEVFVDGRIVRLHKLDLEVIDETR